MNANKPAPSEAFQEFIDTATNYLTAIKHGGTVTFGPYLSSVQYSPSRPQQADNRWLLYAGAGIGGLLVLWIILKD